MNLATYGIYFIFFIIFASITVLLIFGILYKPSPNPIVITPHKGNFNKHCTEQIFECNTDQDCQNACIEQTNGIQMGCKTLTRSTPSQIATYGKSQKVCAPVNASTDSCDPKYGGLLSWSGWSGLPVMDWECICSYPAYASTDSCKNINPDICAGPQPNITDPSKKAFRWSAVTSKSDPKYTDCYCPSGSTRLVSDYTNKPICAPTNIKVWYSDLSRPK